ncbi:MAG: hypothetical protein ACTSXH_06920 [Promethearchaeota archaeon]
MNRIYLDITWQASCSPVDPDARLGYCAAKKKKFLGYRIQLLIDDKKKSP